MIALAQDLPEVRRLESLASRSTTPCGPDATMVWRRWGEGPALFLLHGGSGAWNHWIRNIDVLARQRTVWAADLPGCGESGLPHGAYDADSIHHHVAAGIALCAPGEAIELAGFSFGSLVAGLIAADHPALIKTLILVAPPALGIRGPKLELKSLGRTMPAEEHERTVRHNLAALMLHDANAIDDEAVSLHAANFARDRLRLRRLARTDLMTRLQRRWKCAVHAIWGREDILVRQSVDRLPSSLAHCDLRSHALIDNAGHWAQYEQPEAFHAALLATLR